MRRLCAAARYAVGREPVPGQHGLRLMPSHAYGNRHYTPGKCDCGKRSYRTETAALAAAEGSAETFGVPFRAYKCPGHRVWHVTSHGFHPRALKSRARVIAWHLDARRVTTRAYLYQRLGLAGPGDRKAKNVRDIIREFARLGLVSRDDPKPGYLTVTGHSGLVRIMQVGLEEYAQSRGIDTGRRRGAGRERTRRASPDSPGASSLEDID